MVPSRISEGMYYCPQLLLRGGFFNLLISGLVFGVCLVENHENNSYRPVLIREVVLQAGAPAFTVIVGRSTDG